MIKKDVNMSETNRKVTVIYCSDYDLSLYRKTKIFKLDAYGELIIPSQFKIGKTIVAMCDGEVDIINTIGDKLISPY
jgi:uncharacterized protein (TIGR02922 family)